MPSPELTQDPRREVKIVVSHLTPHQLRHVIWMNKAGFLQIHHRRRINNIYLDTQDFRHYYENVNGLPKRTKPRIRWYGKTTGAIRKPVLELKAKDNLWGTKQRFPLEPTDRGPSFFNDPLACCGKGLPGGLERHSAVMGNSYVREYYLSRDGRYRLTLDTEVDYFEVHRQGGPRFSPELRDPPCRLVIEIKCDREHEAGLPSIVSTFPFRVTRNSKYVNGVRRIHGKG